MGNIIESMNRYKQKVGVYISLDKPLTIIDIKIDLIQSPQSKPINYEELNFMKCKQVGTHIKKSIND